MEPILYNDDGEPIVYRGDGGLTYAREHRRKPVSRIIVPRQEATQTEIVVPWVRIERLRIMAPEPSVATLRRAEALGRLGRLVDPMAARKQDLQEALWTRPRAPEEPSPDELSAQIRDMVEGMRRRPVL